MKNRRFWLGMLVMALVFGMTVVGCDSDSDDDGGDVLKGTWYDHYNGNKTSEIVASGGAWTLYTYDNPGVTLDKSAFVKGTYTKGATVPGVPATTVSIRITHMNTGEGTTVQWTAYDDLPAEKQEFIGQQTMTGTVSGSGNTLTISGDNGGTYQKQQ
jgi:hypothetical protein